MAPTPHAEFPEGSRQAAIRCANDRIAASAENFRFDESAAVPFLCECDDPECAEFVPLPLPAYRHARRRADAFTVPGHRIEAARLVDVTPARNLFRLL